MYIINNALNTLQKYTVKINGATFLSLYNDLAKQSLKSDG